MTARIAGYYLNCPAPAEAFGSHEWLAWLTTVLMRVVVLSAATGELVWDHTNTTFWQMRGWELRGWLCEAIRCAQYFSVILLVQQLLLCDMACIGEYAEGEVLTIYMLRRGIANPTDFNLQQATAALRSSDRFRLWSVLSQGIHMRVLLPAIPNGMERISPLVLAIQSRHQEHPHQEQDLPNTVQALLWACCSPHDFGMPEVSPLCEALRSGDDEIVLLLLQYRASPSRREDGSNDPIFVAIQMSSAENVRRLLQFSADPRSREAVPSREGHAGRRRLRRRTAMEAAAAHPHCQRVIRDFIIGT